jgi:U3 small nucleolar RNA-associated protein 5
MAKIASSAGVASKKTAEPSASRTQKSSILKSTFAPSAYQLNLFASVIQAFDSQHLRVHDFDNGRLHCDHALGAGTGINSMDWGYYGSDFRDQYEPKPKKKRKRDQDAREILTANRKNAVVALGTTASNVQMFSPAEGRVVGELSGFHQRGVNDFRFVRSDCLWGWSIDGDGKMAQWDLKTNKAVRSAAFCLRCRFATNFNVARSLLLTRT